MQGIAFYAGQLSASEYSGDNKNRYRDMEFFREKYQKAASIYCSLLLQKGQPESAMWYTSIAAKLFEYSSVLFKDSFFSSADSVHNWLLAAFKQDTSNKYMKSIFKRTASTIGRRVASQTLTRIVQARTNALKQTLRPKMLDTHATEFIIERLNGAKVSLSALKGQLVMPDFWATWCGPCIASFPLMQQLVNTKTQSREATSFFVNTWQPEKNKLAVLSEFFLKHPFQFAVLMDVENKVMEALYIKSIPTKIIFNKKGIIRFISVGFYSKKDKSIEDLQTMISLVAEATM